MSTTPEPELHPCQNDLCDRQIGFSATYCCHACSVAAAKHFEIHESGPLGHSTHCTNRWTQRQAADRG